MSLTKDWTANKRELTESERLVLAEITEQGAGDVAESLSYAAVSIHAARKEQERLTEVIKAQRLVIQRLQFPGIYPPDCPAGKEEIAQQIYEVAAHIARLMEREGMREEYDVTYGCMVEVSGYSGDLFEEAQAR